jgi:hypothetical protein
MVWLIKSVRILGSFYGSDTMYAIVCYTKDMYAMFAFATECTHSKRDLSYLSEMCTDRI